MSHRTSDHESLDGAQPFSGRHYARPQVPEAAAGGLSGLEPVGRRRGRRAGHWRRDAGRRRASDGSDVRRRDAPRALAAAVTPSECTERRLESRAQEVRATHSLD